MDTPSVETDNPPGQEPLRTWPAYGGQITLEPVDKHTAELWFYPTGGERERFGNVTFDEPRQRFIPEWNAAGRMHLGRHQLDVMDSAINYAMARRMR
jgi:hypothetical protein